MKYLPTSILLCLLTGCGTTLTPQGAQTAQEAWNTVRRINRHWAITENLDSLGLYLHPDMVLVSPDGMVQGKNRILEAYRSYAAYAQTLEMEETKPVIQLYNGHKTAVVTYRNDLTIRTADNRIESFACRDMYTLIFEQGKWRAVAQHYAFLKPE